jgi:methionyl-tRNA synthetase
MTRIDPSAYIQAAVARSRVLNLYIDKTKPWSLAKDPANRAELGEVLYTLLEGIRWTATALLPVLPFKMPDVFRQLGVKAPEEQGAFRELSWGAAGQFKPVQPEPLYPRLELPPETGKEPPK